MGTLTVRENLMFSANLRLSSMSQKDKRQRVEDTLQELGLTSCADTKVSHIIICSLIISICVAFACKNFTVMKHVYNWLYAFTEIALDQKSITTFISHFKERVLVQLALDSCDYVIGWFRVHPRSIRRRKEANKHWNGTHHQSGYLVPGRTNYRTRLQYRRCSHDASTEVKRTLPSGVYGHSESSTEPGNPLLAICISITRNA